MSHFLLAVRHHSFIFLCVLMCLVGRRVSAGAGVAATAGPKVSCLWTGPGPVFGAGGRLTTWGDKSDSITVLSVVMGSPEVAVRLMGGTSVCCAVSFAPKALAVDGGGWRERRGERSSSMLNDWREEEGRRERRMSKGGGWRGREHGRVVPLCLWPWFWGPAQYLIHQGGLRGTLSLRECCRVRQ